MNRAICAFFLLASAATLSDASWLVAQTTTGKACGLVTESEIQSVLGAKVTLKGGAIGEVQTCSGEAPAAAMTMRLFKRTGDPSATRF